MMEDTQVNTLKACIISRKGGIPICELNDDYKELVGEDIPYRAQGYKSLQQYLWSMDGVSIKGDSVHCATKESQHIQDMINKQKSKISTRKRKPDNCDKISYPLKKKVLHKKMRYDSPPKAYYYDPQNCAFQKNIFMYNHAYDEYDCLFGERNLIYNLVFSLCQVLTHSNIDISSCLSSNTIGNSTWLDALRCAPPLEYRTRNCFQLKTEGNIILCGHQVIGDDCVIQLAAERFGFTPGGTCLPGLTLREAQHRFIRGKRAKNVLIICGSLDIHNGVLLEQVVSDMQDLILCVLLSGCVPVVCSLPPSPYYWLNHQISAFNYWLTTLTNIVRIDLYSPFIDKCSRINYKYFTRDAKVVGGSRIYLWSKAGQDVIMKTILSVLHSSR